MTGLILAAPASGSGKTVVTLALLRAFSKRGVWVAAAKVGPDYIDSAFHAATGASPCLNLDSWAMRAGTLSSSVARLSQAALVLCEGVMGMFDGAEVAQGVSGASTADLAALTGWPVILLVDVAGQAASAAALVSGFLRHRPEVAPVAVLFNRVGSERHRALVAGAMARTLPDLPILGWLPRNPILALPERHLGLVQAIETPDLAARLDAAAVLVEKHVDLDALGRLARPSSLAGSVTPVGPPIPPFGQHIAVARDAAFAFTYPLILDGWRQAGAGLSFFSPLADEAPDADADAIYLPGGYPELHAGRLAAADKFLGGLRRHAAQGGAVWGECGGYMVLGESLEGADGAVHRMAGLLPLATSFRQRRLHLGYRRIMQVAASPLGPAASCFRGHEFHYATIQREGPGEALFEAADSMGRDLGAAGLVNGKVAGSFLHLIDRDPG